MLQICSSPAPDSVLSTDHEVRCECGECWVHYEGDEEHEDREPGDGEEGEGEGGVEFYFLLNCSNWLLSLLLLAESLFLHDGQHLCLAQLAKHQWGDRVLLVPHSLGPALQTLPSLPSQLLNHYLHYPHSSFDYQVFLVAYCNSITLKPHSPNPPLPKKNTPLTTLFAAQIFFNSNRTR